MPNLVEVRGVLQRRQRSVVQNLARTHPLLVRFDHNLPRARLTHPRSTEAKALEQP